MNRVVDWLRQAEAQLDAWGRPAWFTVMVLGFILVWPIGLAILFYMIWSNRMNCARSHRPWRRSANHGPTGNAAFDEYREETLKRLEEEQTAFEQFMKRLRQAKDKAEFDQFMAERRNKAGHEGAESLA